MARKPHFVRDKQYSHRPSVFPNSLISTFIILSLENIIDNLASYKISIFNSEAEQGGLNYSWQGFSYLSEVRARGLLNLGNYHLDHQSWENLMQSKRTGSPF